jgi:hypothetical protein
VASNSILAKLAVLLTGDNSGLNKSLNQSQKQLSTFSQAATGVSKSLAGLVAGISFAAVAKQMLDVTTQFQKFEAVLTNTLGSNSEAQEALDSIREFAAKTPFSVQELTGSFVKLANQGFKPTSDEMRKLGDLASSTGKGFDQLAEAIIDAQTGEFERLKEFGIRASKAGDQVKFTFKGVETQTKFTSASIQEYLLSLGDVEGVSGSMAAISQTLGGKISNLGDSFDNLLLTLGNLTSGPLAGFVDLLSEALQNITDLATEDKVPTRLETVNELYVKSADSIEEITANLEKLQRLKKIEDAGYQSTTEKLGSMKDQLNLTAEQLFKLTGEQRTAKEFADAYGAAITALTAKQEELNKKLEVQAVALIPALNAEIKKYEDLKNSSFSEEQIGRYNNKIRELRDELELLNATGSESGFLKNLNANQAAGKETVIPEVSSEVPNAFPTTLPVPNASEIVLANDAIALSYERSGQAAADAATVSGIAQDAIIAKQQQATEAALQYGSAIGDSLADAISGQKSFSDSMKKLTGELVKIFLQRALAGIISSAATSGGPPPVAIALAAAGVAAISAMFSKIGASGGGGGGSVGAAKVNTAKIDTPLASANSRVEFDANFRLEGDALVAALNNTQNQNERLRG